MYTKRDDSPRLRSVLVAVYPEPIEKIPQYPDDSAGDSVLASWTIDIESGDDVQSEVARGIGAAKQFIDEKEYSTDKMIEDIRAGFDEVLPGDHTE
ncbi:hypothetical protein D3261_02705 [Halococcus sp. IIIV-5B]|nr:hypothetical protein D3261_02705 [Halococcus sp. IIIV-5B]